LILDSFAVGHN